MTTNETPNLATTCTQCGNPCQSVDQYSDCCNEPVAVVVPAEFCTCYKGGNTNPEAFWSSTIANCPVNHPRKATR